MIPEKMAAFADAQMVVAANVLSGRPDLAPAEVVALYRDRVSANEQPGRLEAPTKWPNSSLHKLSRGGLVSSTERGLCAGY